MQSLGLASVTLCSLASLGSAQSIPGVVTTTNMGTGSTHDIVNLTNGPGLAAMHLDATHAATCGRIGNL